MFRSAGPELHGKGLYSSGHVIPKRGRAKLWAYCSGSDAPSVSCCSSLRGLNWYHKHSDGCLLPSTGGCKLSAGGPGLPHLQWGFLRAVLPSGPDTRCREAGSIAETTSFAFFWNYIQNQEPVLWNTHGGGLGGQILITWKGAWGFEVTLSPGVPKVGCAAGPS